MALKHPFRWANPAVLGWARTRLNLQPTQVERLSEKMGRGFTKISAERLLSWEQGQDEPTLADLETLAYIYECPLGYFFLPNPPEERLPLDFRGLDSSKLLGLSPETHIALRRFVSIADWVGDVIRRLEIPWEVRINEVRLTDFVDDVAQKERTRLGFDAKLRYQWGDAHTAFQWWRLAVESLGVFVFTMRLPPKEVRGASIWSPPNPPAILVNSEDVEAATGRLFTLLHEYAHLLIRRQGVVCDTKGLGESEPVEKFANRLAARILLQQDEFKAHLQQLNLFSFRSRWGDALLDEIRKPFFVSKDVVAIYLEEMGLAPEGFYQQKRQQWEKRGPGRRGYAGKPPPKRNERKLRELGFSFARILSSEFADEIPILELAEVLDMKVEHVQEFKEWLKEQAPVRRI
ncbi:MAG: XRE family transcriptional regulator [Chloroflexota bacterium]|nr:XRE family transcriptional regulator [Chloroflexota bacterium]